MGNRKVKIDLAANESLTVEVPMSESSGDRSGEPMFAKLYLWLRESGNLAKMSGAACKMYCALLTRADFNELDCWPSQNRIADDAGISRRQVSRAAKELTELGLVSKISGKSKLGNKFNRYVIIKPPLGHDVTRLETKCHKGRDEMSPPLGHNRTNPSDTVTHKQDTINKHHITTTIDQISCGSGDKKYLMRILERIERVFKKKAVNASVRIDEVVASFEVYSEREIVGQIGQCNDGTRMWSGLGYWLENYAKVRAKTKVTVADEIAAERGRIEEAERRAEQGEDQPISRDEIVAATRAGLEIATEKGDNFWINHHRNRLEFLLKE